MSGHIFMKFVWKINRIKNQWKMTENIFNSGRLMY